MPNAITTKPEMPAALVPSLRTTRGRSVPLGATPLADGVNFVLMCRHGTAVSLVLQSVDGDSVLAEIPMDRLKNRTGDHWHVLVAGLPSAFRYGWRVNGPTGGGHRFNSKLVLLDPGGTARLGRRRLGRRPPFRYADSTARIAAACSFAARSTGTRMPRSLTPLEDTIIYELHVRGFTCHPSSVVAQPGTFAGLDREDSLSARARHHRRRTAADPRVRRGRLPVHQSRSPARGCATSGATTASPSPRPRPPMPPPGRSTARSTNSARWSGPFTPPASKSSSTSSSTTPAKATTAAEPIPFAAWTTSSITCSDPQRQLPQLLRLRQHGQLQPSGRPRPDPDLPALLGRPTCTSTACASIWPRSWAATARAMCWSSRRWSR